MKQRKSTLSDKLIPIFVQTTNLFERTSNNQSVQTIRYSKRNWGKKWDEVYRIYNKGVKVSELSLFSTIFSQFWTLSEILLQLEIPKAQG